MVADIEGLARARDQYEAMQEHDDRRQEQAIAAAEFMHAVLKPMCPSIDWGDFFEVYDGRGEVWCCKLLNIEVQLDDGAREAMRQFRDRLKSLLRDVECVYQAMEK